MHDHDVCACVTVYWAPKAHPPTIPGTNAETADAEFVDRYDYLGYGSGVDECYDSEDY